MQSYLSLLNDILVNGENHDDRTGVGTRSVFGRQWRHNMRSGFPLLTTKRVPLRWVFEELMWFLRGQTNERELAIHGVDIWKEWATADQCSQFGRQEGDLGPVYGHLWRQFGLSDASTSNAPGCNPVAGVDQIANLLRDLEINPNSRRLIVSGWHPHLATRVALPPCHTLWQCKVHANGELSLQLYARSIDVFLGLPFNIASYGLLLELLGAITERQTRELIISFGDLHLYNNHQEQAIRQLSRDPRPLPKLYASTTFPEHGTSLERLLSVKWEDICLLGYQPHSKIEAEVAV
jgi:thymidylate synthase